MENKILETVEASNLSINEIAKFHKTSREEVIKILINNGYLMYKDNPNARLPSSKRLKKASDRFIKEGCNNTTITKIAEEEGLRKSSLKEYLQKYYPEIQLSRIEFKYNIFDSIDSEEKAYWLGFLFADGYISNATRNSYSIELTLSSKDLDHLRKFANFIGYTGEIKTRNVAKKAGEDKKYVCSRIFLSSKHLWESLNKLGCTPRKSLTLKFPDENIFKSKNLIRHFIRGYFDGDGTLGIYDNKTGNYIYHNHCLLSFLGTEHMLNGIKNFLIIPKLVKQDGSENHPSKACKLSYVSKEAFTIAFDLYEKSTIYLDRKYIKYLEYCRLYKELYKKLVSNNGEDCDVNPVITFKIAKGLEVS